MITRWGRIGVVFALLAAYLTQLSAPIANAAISKDCTVSGGTYCTETISAVAAIQSWTVPSGITSITVDVQGAPGGNGTGGSSTGGYGARIQATLAVTPGTVLSALVGTAGVAGITAGGGGGGGGSFLVRTSDNTPLVIAGGGGGGQGTCCGTYANGVDASTSTSGTASTINSGSTGAGGTGGNGGASPTSIGAGGGGGFSTDGSDGAIVGNRGRSFLNGGAGGTSSTSCHGSYNTGGNGGFGGGGAACGGAGGGGGGYSGGGGSGGSSNWGAGGGGGSFTAATATNVTSTSPYQGMGAGVIAITYLNVPVVTAFTTAQATPTNTNSSFTFSLTFSQGVSNVANSDFSNSGTASGCVLSISAASGTTFTLTVSSCGEGTVIPQVLANSVLGSATSTNGPSSNAPTTTPVTIDRTAPQISSISVPANSTYLPGNALTFVANMSETVTVTGTPRLAIVVGATTRYATYASGSNSRSLLFTYVVQTTLSDIDTDGIVLNSPLSLNGGTILDLATNALSVFTFTPPTMSGVLVAQKPSAPTIDSISATSGQLAIYFTPGASNGSTITNYEYSTNNGTNWTTRSPIATTSPITISGLVNGTSYPVRIRAINAAGSGDSSTAVSATPTAVLVAGGSDISITYGQSASSSLFTATGGTGIYTFTLSSTPSGVSISNAIVSVDSTTAAGIYTLNVIATDNAGSPQSGSKQIVITVAKATSSISIALPSSATSAALNGAVIITATVSKPGSVNFKLGGTTISGCGAASASTTTATCSWTPGALGSVSLTAIFTPTDASNYETSTTATLSITVVNGVSTITLSLTGGTTTVPKGQTINIIATIDQAGKVTFLADGKRIPGCINLSASAGTKICAWKPSIQKLVNITATLNPTSNVYNNATSRLAVQVVRRVGTR